MSWRFGGLGGGGMAVAAVCQPLVPNFQVPLLPPALCVHTRTPPHPHTGRRDPALDRQHALRPAQRLHRHRQRRQDSAGGEASVGRACFGGL